MVCLKGKKGKERIEVVCAEKDFTAEYSKLMREGYTISISKAGCCSPNYLMDHSSI